MTTSNKLLLGVLLAGVLALTSTHIALYAKYKAGDFEKVEDESSQFITHKVPGTVKAVRMMGFENCVVSYTGEPAVQIKKGALEKMGLVIQNDTLILISDTTLRMQQFDEGARKNELVRLTLPPKVLLRLDFSSISLNGADTTNLVLNGGSRMNILMREPQLPVHFGQLNIDASYAVIELDDLTQVNELNLTATHTNFQAHEASIKNMNLAVDSSTIISTTRNGLQNLRLVSKP